MESWGSCMTLTISATVLGELAQPGFCPRCFWIKLKSRKLPYQQFPGIFSSIDRYVKGIIRRHFDQSGKLPDWFPPVGEVVTLERVPHYTKFAVTEPKSGVTLRGEPDDVLRLKESTYHIVDYKTARLTPNAAGMYPRYEAQLNAYAYVASRTVFSPVSGLSLIYMEPNTDVEGNNALLARLQEEFLLGFTPKLQTVEMKPDSFVEGLLARAGDLHNQDTPPTGRAGCQECLAVEGLVALTGLGE